MSPITARDVFLVDTATGRVWQRTTMQFLFGEPDVWEPIPRFDTDQDRLDFERQTGFKPAPKAK
jgi:hypothetical protein